MPEFKNPNQGGSAGSGGGQNNSSFLLMIVVMFGVMFGLQYWRAKHNPQTKDESATAEHATTAPTNASPAAATGSAAPLGTSPAVQGSQPAVQGTSESSTVVENELYRITFSNRGAAVSSWVLKKFKDADGHPLDLVHEGASKQFGFPLSLYTYDRALTEGLAQALYVVSGSGTGSTLTAPATLTFQYAFGNVSVTKTFTFGTDYVVHADAVVLRDGAPVRALLSWPAALGDMDKLQDYAGAQVDTDINGKTEHQSFKNVSGGATLNGSLAFAGTSDQYFAAVFLPDQPGDATVATLHNQIDVAKVQRPSGAKGTPSKGTTMVPILGVAVGGLNGHDQARLFVGPKSIHVLKSVPTANGGTLEPLLDFGFWGYIGKFLFLGLQLVHRWIAPAVATMRDYSWGWAVILFTVLINLVLLPLRVQSMKSAVKMQRIQPGVDAIKAKFKNPKPTDPKAAEMNAEVMKYQKEHGVSPLGGCIPTLIQLPLLIAFYTMMTRVVELRQAHWFWLHDLSASDPYKILPILMVATSFLVQYYTPMPGQDPQQQKMMAFMMPLFSGYITWNYAAGLALYWTTGNFINIIQQQVMNRTSLGREMRQIALDRAQRKAAEKAGPLRGSSGKIVQGKR